MEPLDTFLAEHQPFGALPAELLREVAAQAQISEHEAGEAVLIEDGPPATGMWVLLDGSAELIHDAEVVQALAPGECFGHMSLLSGMAPAFTVRCRERSRLALVPGWLARRVLATEPGVVYLARSIRKRLVRAGDTVHGLHEVGTTPVAQIMRPPSFIEPDERVAAALARLGRDGVGALLVCERDGALGIVTDAEVRARAAAGGLAGDAPVRALARWPAPTVSVSEPAVEATVDMLWAGTDHAAVVDGPHVRGVLSASDLLGLEATSPIALRHAILTASDAGALQTAARGLPRLFCALARAGVPSRELGRVLTLAHDAVVLRLTELSVAEHGQAPAPWAWLDLGSAARREFTLASDQDNALAYAPPDGADMHEVDAWFARLGRDVNAGLESAGIGLDNSGVLARDRRWRMTKQAWVRTFDDCLQEPDESHLVRATVAFDFRSVAGALSVTPELTARIRAAREHPQLMALIARSAAGFPVALTFRGHLARDPDGCLDLKRGAILPLVNVARWHALAAGVTISATLDRLEAVAALGSIGREEADALIEAFEVITRVRFEHHARLIGEGLAPENRLDPGELGPIARRDLREALLVVRRAQRRLPA
ncbi:MAG TPA: putative nucleotidyltransferase substrate binding domain-containing protein [Solirubrobacteraceae bacterium]|nr:putative nucleotidyltransferase substrate binding domain-containing protein [Solirubrobacteraceae bacterium]